MGYAVEIRMEHGTKKRKNLDRNNIGGVLFSLNRIYFSPRQSLRMRISAMIICEKIAELASNRINNFLGGKPEAH